LNEYLRRGSKGIIGRVTATLKGGMRDGDSLRQ
jgi:hypothetical protein